MSAWRMTEGNMVSYNPDRKPDRVYGYWREAIVALLLQENQSDMPGLFKQAADFCYYHCMPSRKRVTLVEFISSTTLTDHFPLHNIITISWIQWILPLPVLLLSSTIFSCSAHAHAGVHEEIQALTVLIQQDPANPQWYLQRGDLYRIHEDWTPALADFSKARQFGAGAAAELGLGRTLLEQGSPQQALAHLNRALSLQPGDVRALVSRAKSYRALGEPLAASTDYSRAIGQFHAPAKPLPEYYLERARAFAAAGEAHIGEALQGLDEGMQVLGNIQTLALYAVELESRRGNFDAALLRLDPILDGASRKEFLLLERGDILVSAGRMQAARQDFIAAQAAVATLPPRYRQTRSVQQLQTEIASRLLLSEPPDDDEQRR